MERNKIFTIGIISMLMVTTAGYGILLYKQNKNDIDETVENIFTPIDKPTWNTINVITPELIATGEANPGSGQSGWLAMFLLNYTGETPGTVLQGNATDWENAANTSGYADTDGWSLDVPSDAGYYFVVRCRFNKTHLYDSGDSQFVHTRARVNLTVSGDETISGTSGTAVVSQNDSGDNYIWINYYWDDGSDGYRVTDDGSITVSEIKIEAKY